MKAADADANDEVFPLLDALYLLVYGFVSGPQPPAPFPDCGADVEGFSDSVGCEESLVCP